MNRQNRRHIPDLDLERYYLGMISDETELARLEEHLLACAECVVRAEASDEYVDSMRQTLILGDFDVELNIEANGRLQRGP